MPYVSVVIPAYNAADFVIDAYRSIVDQTIDDWEIIFVNDGSQDDTLSIIQSLASTDKRVKVVDLALNSGPACARNSALAIAEGDWIAMLDADDRFSPDRLEVATRAGELHAADIVLDNLFVVDAISGRTIFLAFEPNSDDLTIMNFPDFLRNIQSDTVFDFGYLKPIIRRRWLAANDIKYSDKLRRRQDLMLLLECYARHPSVILLSRAYYYYYLQFRTEANVEPLLAEIEQFLGRHQAQLTLLERRLVVSACESLREDMMVAALRAYLKHFDIISIICSLKHPIRLFRGLYFAKRRGLLYRRRIRSSERIKSHVATG